MESSMSILTDLQAVLTAGHDAFSFLSLYKGVPMVCRAQLVSVGKKEARFVVQPPESVVLLPESALQPGPEAHASKPDEAPEKPVTLVLSDGLLEPLEATVTCLDLASGEFSLSGFTYAGSKFANRRELRVEPKGGESVEVASDGRKLAGEIADLSVRGLGVLLKIQELTTTFSPGKLVAISLNLIDKQVSMEGKIRSLMRLDEHLRLAIEFTGAVPEKTTIIHYVMKRRSEIMAEVRALFASTIQQKD